MLHTCVVLTLIVVVVRWSSPTVSYPHVSHPLDFQPHLLDTFLLYTDTQSHAMSMERDPMHTDTQSNATSTQLTSSQLVNTSQTNNTTPNWSISIAGVSIEDFNTLSHTIDQTIELASSYATVLGPHQLNHFDIHSLHVELVALQAKFDRSAAIKNAALSASNFEFPPEVFTHDLDQLRTSASLEDLIKNRRDSIIDGRFNPQRVLNCFKDDPEFQPFMSLATQGAIIDTPHDFSRKCDPEPPRKLHVQLQSCLSLLTFIVWHKERGLLFPLA